MRVPAMRVVMPVVAMCAHRFHRHGAAVRDLAIRIFELYGGVVNTETAAQRRGDFGKNAAGF